MTHASGRAGGAEGIGKLKKGIRQTNRDAEEKETYG